MTRYEQGFMRKCAEYGVDHATARKMMKAAVAPVAFLSSPTMVQTSRPSEVVDNSPGHNKWVSYNHLSDGSVVPVLTPEGTNYVNSTSEMLVNRPAKWTGYKSDPWRYRSGDQKKWQGLLDRANTHDGYPEFRSVDEPFINRWWQGGWWPGKWEFEKDWSSDGILSNLVGKRDWKATYKPDYDAAAEILENTRPEWVLMRKLDPNSEKMEIPVKTEPKPRPASRFMTA